MKQKVILVVDDTPDLRKNITQFLAMEGYMTITAGHGQEALERIAEMLPDTIITDILMPVMDGYTLIEQIKSNPQLKNIPIIVFSAKPEAESKHKVLALGAFSFISKPGSIDEIMTTVNEIV